MYPNINLGRVDKNAFKESNATLIVKSYLEKNNKIKTHFMEMDRTPNFDGKVMILAGSFERITVEVQIKTLPQKPKKYANGEFGFPCDTKAMNCVLKNVTLNPVVLFAVDINKSCIYYKLLTKEYLMGLNIKNQKTKTIRFGNSDKYNEDTFIREIFQLVKITESDVDCLTECGKIRESVRNINNTTKRNSQCVYQRADVKGYFSSYKRLYDNNTKFILLSEIRMNCGNVEEILYFQYENEFITINRPPAVPSNITDADIANIILEVEKEIKRPIMYTNAGKPTYWFDNKVIWQLRAEEILRY